MTRLTADERAAIAAELDACLVEIRRLQALLDSQPAGSDGDTVRLLQALCSCGLPLDHRHPGSGEPRPCADETARIALDEARSRPPVPQPVQTTPGGWSFRADLSGRAPSAALQEFVDGALRRDGSAVGGDACRVAECLGIECMNECSSSQRLEVFAARAASEGPR